MTIENAQIGRARALLNRCDSFQILMYSHRIPGRTIEEGLPSLETWELASLIAELEELLGPEVSFVKPSQADMAAVKAAIAEPCQIELPGEPVTFAMGLTPPGIVHTRLDKALATIAEASQGHVSVEDWAAMEREIRKLRDHCGIMVKAIRRVYDDVGPPGEFGYSTREGKALKHLYDVYNVVLFAEKQS